MPGLINTVKVCFLLIFPSFSSGWEFIRRQDLSRSLVFSFSNNPSYLGLAVQILAIFWFPMPQTLGIYLKSMHMKPHRSVNYYI